MKGESTIIDKADVLRFWPAFGLFALKIRKITVEKFTSIQKELIRAHAFLLWKKYVEVFILAP